MAAHASSCPFTVLIAGLFFGAAAQAQSFDYADFSSVAGLVMNGGAAQSGTVLRMTTDVGGLATSCYYDTPVGVVGGFDCVFVFQITNGGGNGADGMTFIIHNDLNGLSAVGECCSPLGYSQFSTSASGTAMENGLVVEIDTYNAGNGDISANSVSIHTSGSGPLEFDESASLGQIAAGIDMSDGAVHTMRVQHDGSQLNVFLDDLMTPLLSVAYSFATGGTYASGSPVGGLNLIGGTDAYVGFTAGTGGLSEIHDILSWSWTSGSGLGTNYCLAASNSTGGAAQISAVGSDSVVANDVILNATPVPNQPGIFYYGPNQIQQVFGNGFGCVGGVLGRLGVTNAIGGTLTYALDNTAPPNGATMITPGSTWNFQAWYRDPAAGGAFFNLSDGLEVLFSL